MASTSLSTRGLNIPAYDYVLKELRRRLGAREANEDSQYSTALTAPSACPLGFTDQASSITRSCKNRTTRHMHRDGIRMDACATR